MNGNKLKNMREKRGLLQKELGDKLKISASTIGMYEQNRREPDNLTLKNIANFFEVSIDYLLDNENNSYINEKELKENDFLKKVLVNAGYMRDDENLTNEEVENLMKFLKINKEFIKSKK